MGTARIDVQPQELNFIESGNNHPPTGSPCPRPVIRGKFFYVGQKKIYIRGVTYGPFRPDETGNCYHTPKVVKQDFSLMAANNINAVRVYTVPPRWLLDIAQQYGIWVMVGLEWEQYFTFLDYRGMVKTIDKRIQSGVQNCAGHPAVLCYALGNEIPAPIVRWYGSRRTERFIHHLYRLVKTEDPEGLVTYVNYPTTEYLRLPFIDFLSFNVYLEERDRLEAYLPRLQNFAGDRPLVMAEIGLDSQRNGENLQAGSLDWQVRTAYSAGCAGAFIFSWTDEWFRGGEEVIDWDFGLTRRDRSPKPALRTVRQAFSEVPFPQDINWPSISVVICSYNGEKTIRAACEALNELDYPDYEVIVVNDGSTDTTPVIIKEYGYKSINTRNLGLSSARNLGMRAARGEIIAYLDDDAYPDRHWLKYLAMSFLRKNYAGLGGPNIPPAGDGLIAESVANSPGNPTHILLSDEEAEHIPGCNMAFRKSALEETGGFDPRFRIAGDDIDICWKLQERGWKLGFSPAAIVWHHRRNSIRAFLRQQLNYGKAEGLLERKWPEKYNSYGHLDWQGRLYGNGVNRQPLFGKWRIYHGVWGSRYFQSIYETKPGSWFSIVFMPEWYLAIFGLMLLSALGTLWSPLYYALIPLGLAAFPLVFQAIRGALHAASTHQTDSRLNRLRMGLLTASLYILQPLARLCGRMTIGLTPWRRHGSSGISTPRRRTDSIWSETWKASEQRLEEIEAFIRKNGKVVLRGGEFDRWDLQIRGGLVGSIRLLMATEVHGRGKQMLRFRAWPEISKFATLSIFSFELLSAIAVFFQARQAVIILITAAFLLLSWAIGDCAVAMAAWLRVLEQLRGVEKELNEKQTAG